MSLIRSDDCNSLCTVRNTGKKVKIKSKNLYREEKNCLKKFHFQYRNLIEMFLSLINNNRLETVHLSHCKNISIFI